MTSLVPSSRSGNDERAWGRAWHTPTNPPLSQRQVIDELSEAATGNG